MESPKTPEPVASYYGGIMHLVMPFVLCSTVLTFTLLESLAKGSIEICIGHTKLKGVYPRLGKNGKLLSHVQMAILESVQAKTRHY